MFGFSTDIKVPICIPNFVSEDSKEKKKTSFTYFSNFELWIVRQQFPSMRIVRNSEGFVAKFLSSFFFSYLCKPFLLFFFPSLLKHPSTFSFFLNKFLSFFPCRLSLLGVHTLTWISVILKIWRTNFVVPLNNNLHILFFGWWKTFPH